ncbi:hypothetical protein DPMN_149261 [Dreissena polymorpha]|uniref:Uncharacterized protein n=1 Tax=Dreissena polymorpha TaxID=45954 RepID=A0A9D4FDF4_DREPO|nr:hypothetical protein DPMN_149261 [Dreissena polymorpha]
MVLPVAPQIESDMRNELNRFISFERFPPCNAYGLRLAQAGFFYTGCSEIVECFCCHRCYSRWNTDDVIFLTGRFMHAANCAFVLGTDRSNVLYTIAG